MAMRTIAAMKQPEPKMLTLHYATEQSGIPQRPGRLARWRVIALAAGAFDLRRLRISNTGAAIVVVGASSFGISGLASSAQRSTPNRICALVLMLPKEAG
ncbi:hypothetical protein K490DRAFT_66272 [Saccharata proteae CBS 121410]|uniref:Uncharacterized protein n=1 Tax=Saccharata proteae CBS 121410 TaxID=1314787 RepID=A0A9P4HXC0_9PEZI|nr:hypothetical protein K490DRAFT_66272 [Saccharata proteae CBS 121410]